MQVCTTLRRTVTTSFRSWSTPLLAARHSHPVHDLPLLCGDRLDTEAAALLEQNHLLQPLHSPQLGEREGMCQPLDGAPVERHPRPCIGAAPPVELRIASGLPGGVRV